MISMVLFEGQYCPVLVCFVCSERIDAENPGNVNWTNDEPHRLYAVHKGPKPCQRQFDAAMKPLSLPWESAAMFLDQLMHNFKDPIKEAES